MLRIGLWDLDIKMEKFWFGLGELWRVFPQHPNTLTP